VLESLIGVCCGSLFRLRRYLAGGSLWDYLHDASVRYTWATATLMALDICRGLNHLHSAQPPIIHRDLKSPNLLLDRVGRWGPCVVGYADVQLSSAHLL
jgi:serine/threonine protein kinase